MINFYNQDELMPDFAVKNLAFLREMKIRPLSRASGISEPVLYKAARYPGLTTKKSYNRIAEYCGWQKWE